VSRSRLVLDFLTRGEVYGYGPRRSQRADLYLPLGAGPHPVMITVHGGAWSKRYGRSLMRGLAGDLLRRGWAVWNIEYRRLGEDGAGWPGTFEDVAAAIDHLRSLDAPLDLDGVSILGHSSGGHLALWAAARAQLPPGAPGSEPAVLPTRAIGQAAVVDLSRAYEVWHGGPLTSLMGGSPEQFPDRYAAADPLRLGALDIPVLLVHGTVDRTVSIKPARRYAKRAQDEGKSVELIEIEGPGGSHRSHVDPRSQAWTAVTRWLGQPVGV
jgi:acetyl esterase/lipase